MKKTTIILKFWNKIQKIIPSRFQYDNIENFFADASKPQRELKKVFQQFLLSEQIILFHLYKKHAPHVYLFSLFLYLFQNDKKTQLKIFEDFLVREDGTPNNIQIWKDYFQLIAFHGSEFKNDSNIKDFILCFKHFRIQRIDQETLDFIYSLFQSKEHKGLFNTHSNPISSSVDLKLGYSCNDNCLHCVVGDFRDYLSEHKKSFDRTTTEYKDLLREYRKKGYMNVTLTGGEPTIRKDCIELLSFAWSIGFYILVQTNGRNFSKDSIMNQLNFGKDRIEFTLALHGPNAKVHDAVTRTKGSYKETIHGLNNLVVNGYKVVGKIVLSQLNYPHLKETVKKFVEYGVSRGSVAFPHATGNAGKYFDTVVPTYKEIIPIIHDLILYQKKSKEKLFFDFETMPFCFLQGMEEYVGELSYLGETDIVLDAYAGGKDDWQKLRISIKKKFKKCEKCKYFNFCEGPWNEYPEKRGESEFIPVKGEKWLLDDIRNILYKRKIRSH